MTLNILFGNRPVFLFVVYEKLLLCFRLRKVKHINIRCITLNAGRNWQTVEMSCDTL